MLDINVDIAFDLAALLTTRSHSTPDGHRIWEGDDKGRILRQGETYTYRQAAHYLRTGTHAIGPVRTMCGTRRCFLHIIDLGSIPGQPTTPNPHWRQLADCIKHDPNLWFPEDHDSPTATVTAEALLICQTCPVRAYCLDEVLTAEGGTRPENRYGIRGGLTPKQRQDEYARRLATGRIRREEQAAKEGKAKPKRQPAQCGTRPGYQKHLREKTKVCTPCRQANTDADNRLRRTGTSKKVPA